MNIIEPKYEIIEQQYGDDLLKDMYKHIEICGRNCYKSEDKITNDSYIKFVENLEKANHGAMLEHGTVYLSINSFQNQEYPDIRDFYSSNPYSRKTTIGDYYIQGAVNVYITTNFRVLVENNRLNDLKYICKPTEHHEKRYTVKFTCDIGVTREYNRHRVNSPAEESTRYCNYSKNKFGNELNICKPVWLDTNQETDYKYFIDYIDAIFRDEDKDNFIDLDYWMFANMACEYSYMNLIRLQWQPQQARTILPLDTKSTLVHTAFASDWKRFFDLRAIGTTGTPHPSAKELAEPLMKEFIERKYID